MSQSALTTPDGDGQSVLNEIAAALQALGSVSSGPVAPGTTYDHQLWADTTSGMLKIRNGANTAWITLGPLDTWGLGNLAHADYYNDRVVSGLLPGVPSPASLTTSIPSGAAYITGARVLFASQNITVNASSDTYVDISNQGAVTLAAVANGATAPAVTASSIRIAKVVSNATQISSVTDLRQLVAQLNEQVEIDLAAGFTGNILRLLVGATQMFAVNQAGDFSAQGNATVGGNLNLTGTASVAAATATGHAVQRGQVLNATPTTATTNLSALGPNGNWQTSCSITAPCKGVVIGFGKLNLANNASAGIGYTLSIAGGGVSTDNTVTSQFHFGAVSVTPGQNVTVLGTVTSGATAPSQPCTNGVMAIFIPTP